jgi:hypothetical protein
MSGSPQYTIDRAVGFFPEETNVPGLVLLDYCFWTRRKFLLRKEQQNLPRGLL